LAATLEARSEDLAQPPVPTISQTHRAFLSRVARRTVRDVVLGRKTYEPQYIPESLQKMTAEVVVRLNHHGYLLGTAGGGPGPIAPTIRDAALKAATSLVANDAVDLDLANKLLIEIEVVGTPQLIEVEGDWTRPRVMDPFVEPGVHGLVLIGPTVRHRFCPTELFTTDLTLADALTRLAQASHTDQAALANVRLMRFRSVHWYEPGPNDPVVSLHRGLTIVGPEEVTPEILDQSIARLAEYMAYRQLDTGLFAYQYEPGRDRYSAEQNLVRQVGAVVAMSVHAKSSGKSASLAAADLGIRYHLQGLARLPGADDATYIATADGRNKLGVTALLCLAMAEHPATQRFEEQRQGLINGILWLQQPTGMFLTAFPPALSVNAQEYFPGESLLAMAVDYSHKPTARVLDAFHQAITFYREYFRGTGSPAFVPWQVQAYALMARHSKREDYADYVFELTDWLAEKQLTRSNCPWPEMWGGIAAYGEGRAGVATASYLEGFAEALALARFVGDAERVKRYETVVRRAARFVMQLQVRPEETYFMRSPQDAVGGIRATPSLNLLRIDHCQHALIGLIKARQVLYPDRG
jgi:AMMECR1 domain-containing protein